MVPAGGVRSGSSARADHRSGWGGVGGGRPVLGVRLPRCQSSGVAAVSRRLLAACVLLVALLAAGLPVSAYVNPADITPGDNSHLPDCSAAQPGEECRHSPTLEPTKYWHTNYWDRPGHNQRRTPCRVSSADGNTPEGGCGHDPPESGYTFTYHTEVNPVAAWIQHWQSMVKPPAPTPAPPQNPTPTPAPTPAPCPSGQVPDGFGGCRWPIISCPPGWSQVGTSCEPPVGLPSDPNLAAPAGLSASCPAGRLQFSWSPVQGAVAYQLVGNMWRVGYRTNGAVVNMPIAERMLPIDTVLWQRSSVTTADVGARTEKWTVRVRAVSAARTGPLSAAVDGYCQPPPPGNANVVCGWRSGTSGLGFGVWHDRARHARSYEIEGTHTASWNLNYWKNSQWQALNFGGDVLISRNISPFPVEAEAVGVRLRYETPLGYSQWTDTFRSVCPARATGLTVACSGGAVAASWDGGDGPWSVTITDYRPN